VIVDLVMWTLNGESTLDAVLKRINEVVPSGCVNNRFIVDDGSSDCTVEIAERNGWDVKRNLGRGISDGANTALSNVETEFFCSFEQDLLLCRDWWRGVEVNIKDERVAAASGVRFSDRPAGLSDLQRYVYKKYIGSGALPAWLRSRQFSSFTLGKTLDNTMWRKQALLDAGGFPNCPSNAGVDTLLAYRFHSLKYVWKVDYSIKSIHIRRGGLREELKHQYWYAASLKETWNKLKQNDISPPINTKGIMFRFFTSPFTGAFVALKTHNAHIAYIHPLIRYYYLKGLMEN